MEMGEMKKRSGRFPAYEKIVLLLAERRRMRCGSCYTTVPPSLSDGFVIFVVRAEECIAATVRRSIFVSNGEYL